MSLGPDRTATPMALTRTMIWSVWDSPLGSGDVEGGREGSFDVRVSYVGQPNQLYDTGATPFKSNGSNLGLPPNWVPAGSTGAMSALGASLAPINIESERRTVALLARYFVSPSWTIFGEYRRQEHDGFGVTSGSFLTEAVQLAPAL